MRKLAFLALAMFALVFVLGCTGGGEDTAGAGTVTGPGYSLKVSPTEVIEEGIVTLDLRLENIFQEDMTDVSVDFKDVSSIYNPQGEVSDVTILPGQSYPVIMSLDGTRAGTLSGKHIEVCFDYDTEYYFDVGLKTKAEATETLAIESGASSGPLGVSVVGLDNVFYENGEGTGSLTLSNTWQGEITELKTISADFPITDDLTKGEINIASCKGETSGAKAPAATCGAYCASSDSAKCSGASTFNANCARVGCQTTCWGEYRGSYSETDCSKSKEDVCVGATGSPNDKPTATATKTTAAAISSSDKTTCGILSNKVAIANGLTLRTKVYVDSSNIAAKSLSVERILGDVKYTYCYEIAMPTITIKSV